MVCFPTIDHELLTDSFAVFSLFNIVKFNNGPCTSTSTRFELTTVQRKSKNKCNVAHLKLRIGVRPPERDLLHVERVQLEGRAARHDVLLQSNGDDVQQEDDRDVEVVDEEGVQALNVVKVIVEEVEELIRESIKTQPELLEAYPTMPTINPSEISNFTDYAYALHDQSKFLRENNSKFNKICIRKHQGIFFF